jgi:alkaline phosphatase
MRISKTFSAIFLGNLGLAACATAPEAVAPARAATALPQIADSYFVSAAGRAKTQSQGERAKNVILFVGDGMGISTVTAARIYAGQRAGREGESNELAMDRFAHTAFSRTYSHDMQIAESAATATAMTTGVKAPAGGLGLTQGATNGGCAEVAPNTAKSLWEIAEDAGLATGIVSTARITHATPAATYAHTVNRGWENDVLVARDKGAPCLDIARQLIEWPHGDGFEVVLGGGRANFIPNTATDPKLVNVKGQRGDGRDLTAEWKANAGRYFVFNAGQLQALGDARGRQVLGLFNPSHMAYDSERARDANGEPSLKDMTQFAIRRLQQSDKGYVLMVEGGRIDHAHHEGKAGQALSETVALDEAIAAALSLTSRDDTLIIVTADHGHAFAIAGYARRGSNILGLSTDMDGKPAKAADGKPYTTLGYLNGPGAVFSPTAPALAGRPDPTGANFADLNYRQQSLTPMESETHAGEDVPIYAWGPNDGAIRGSLEQNVIFHVLADALGFSFAKGEK